MSLLFGKEPSIQALAELLEASRALMNKEMGKALLSP